jgi:hypothetical protein
MEMTVLSTLYAYFICTQNFATISCESSYKSLSCCGSEKTLPIIVQAFYIKITIYLTPWSRDLLQKLIVIQLVKKSPTFMEPEGSLLCPPLVPILSQMHPVHTFPPNFPKIHSNIILPYMPILQLVSYRCSNQNIVCMSSLPMHAICSTDLIFLDLITLDKRCHQPYFVMKVLVMRTAFV